MKNWKHCGGGGGIWGLGFIGALVWVIRNADGVSGFFWGLVQALLWPAFLIYRLFEFLA